MTSLHFRHPRLMSVYWTIIILACAWSPRLWAVPGDHSLTIGAGGVPVAGELPQEREYLAGSPAQLMIAVTDAGGQPVSAPCDSLRATWPSGLVIAVATADGVSHPEWLPEMQLRPYLPRNAIIADSVRRATGRPIPAQYCREHYAFGFRIPAAAAGQTILLSAAFEHPAYGLLASATPAALRIVAAQSDADRRLQWDAEIWAAYHTGDYRMTMALVDSYLVLGYRGASGLAYAMKAARWVGDYAAALRYLDLNMEVNGTYYVDDGCRPQDNDPPELRRRRAEANRPSYQRLRRELLQEIKNQQQQR